MSRYFIIIFGIIGHIKICEFHNVLPIEPNVTSHFMHSTIVKIISGAVADIQDFPYMVSLQYNGTFFGHDYDHFCCGIIIKQKWIITSAQCALARKVNEFHVRVGSSKYYENGAIYNIKNIAIHPNYNNIILDYDVALLELTKSIVFDKNTMPIDIPENNEIIQDKTNISIAGWGATQLLGKISDDLRESHVQKISNEACQLYYGNNSVTNRMFCIFTEGSGPCVGDSGSPAVYNNKVIGLASWSHNCAYGSPTVYAKISDTREWIEKITKDFKS